MPDGQHMALLGDGSIQQFSQKRFNDLVKGQ
jgi:hypothetical protein